MLKGDRVQSPSYGLGTIVEVEDWYRGEPVARVRFDAFVGTQNDRPITTPLAGLTPILVELPGRDGRVILQKKEGT